MRVELEVEVVNAFTCAGQGGNPAGVVLDADDLNAAQMQDIARQMGLSETAFVLPAQAQDFELRFFTPTAEIDFCGHATLAAFYLLHRAGRLPRWRVVQKTRAGNLAVCVDDDGAVTMNQSLPVFGEVLAPQSLAEIMGVDAERVAATGLPIQIVSTGLRDILLPLPDPATLDGLRPDFPALAAFNQRTGSIGVHAFTLKSGDPALSALCRNFAPAFGIDEESATGSSNGALAAYLTRYADRFGGRYLFEQGRSMGATSLISAVVTEIAGAISELQVGGACTAMSRRTLTLD